MSKRSVLSSFSFRIDVLSEALKPAPDDAVLRSLAEQGREAAFTTAMAQADILYGLRSLAVKHYIAEPDFGTKAFPIGIATV